MPQFTSRDLYMMNGGKKIYIYTDGFGDIYNATPNEEKEWQEEIIARDIKRLDTEHDYSVLSGAVETLRYHQYPHLQALLLKKLEETEDSGGIPQLVFAGTLWKLFKYPLSFDKVNQFFLKTGALYAYDLFLALQDFSDNEQAREFLTGCLESNDPKLVSGAMRTQDWWRRKNS
ncbi:hypothetical protein ACX0G9_04905 [Flavitalea flava]